MLVFHPLVMSYGHIDFPGSILENIFSFISLKQFLIMQKIEKMHNLEPNLGENRAKFTIFWSQFELFGANIP